MTDVATRPDGTAGEDDSTTVLDSAAAAPAVPQEVQWAPAEPPRRKKHLGLWLGIPAGVLAVGAAAASMILIAPGVAVAGTNVGLMTPGSAAEAVAANLASSEIQIEGATFTGDQLGLAIDAQAAADGAFESAPAWNLGAWGSDGTAPTLTLDAEKAAATLREALPALYSDSVDAVVAFDEKAGAFTVTPAESGQGVDLDALTASLTAAIADAEPGEAVTVQPQQTEVEAAATTEEAEEFAAGLNAQTDAAGFYLQDKRALGLDLKTVASWMDIASDPATGEFVVTPDTAAIEEAIKDLPAKVNQDVVEEQVVTNSDGDHLRVIQEGQDGFGITSTDGVAGDVSSALQDGNLQFALNGEVVPFTTKELFRRVEVDKSAGTTYMYENEQLVATYPIALGRGGVVDGVDTETQTGHFTVYAQLTSQHMGSCTPDGKHIPGGRLDYCTANVPWISYFNGDQGFHGTYWHNNFGAGARMSHGCVNMTQAAAQHMYKFAQVGTEVWVHD